MKPLDYASPPLGELGLWRTRYAFTVQTIGALVSIFSWLIWSYLWMWIISLAGLCLYLTGLAYGRRPRTAIVENSI